MKSIVLGIVLSVMVGLLGGCGGSGSSGSTPTATLTAIVQSSAPPSIHVGTSAQYTVYGVYSDGTTSDITNTVTWTSSDPTVATVSSSGVVTGVKIGTTNIVAQFSGSAATMNVAVTEANLVTIQVNPVNVSSYAGLTTQYVATGYFDDGSNQDISLSSAWSSSEASVATISATGLATAVSPGVTAINATLSGATGSSTLTVNNATLQSIVVTPSGTSTMHIGVGTQFSATGYYSDGKTADLTSSSQIAWSSSSPAVIVNSVGVAKGMATGAATIQATYGQLSNSVNVNVSAAVAEGLVINAPAAYASANMNVQYTAQVTYSDGTSADVSNSTVWTLTGTPSAATINQHGLLSVAYNAIQGVVVTVNATFGTLSPASVSLQIVGPNLKSWTFEGGSQTPNDPGNTGTSLSPSARNHSAYTVDGDGNFWLFGGTDYTNTDVNDLWMYSVNNGWKLVNDASGFPGTFPVDMTDSAAFYVSDGSGNPGSGYIYLFGGWKFNDHTTINNSLWVFDIAGKVWVNLSDALSTMEAPGPRAQHRIVPANEAGKQVFYMFGGVSYDSATGQPKYLNDLWVIDMTPKNTASNPTWTQVLSNNPTPSYGTQGVASASNETPGRASFNMWVANGKVWIFGGNSATPVGGLNDLWFIDLSTDPATEVWVSGNSDLTIPGYSIYATYGQLGIPSPANTPGVHAESGASWTDSSGNLWLTSGYGSGVPGVGYGTMNDIWQFNPNMFQWTWMGGANYPNQPTAYTQVYITTGGVAVTPSGRLAAASWVNPADGSLWMFGGWDGDWHNDLWRYGSP